MTPIICLIVLIATLIVVAFTKLGEHNKGKMAFLASLIAISLTRLLIGWHEVGHKIGHAWHHILEIGCLVTFFTMLGYIFKTSRLPDLAPKWLPDG